MNANRIVQTLGRALGLLLVGAWVAGVTTPPRAAHSANPYAVVQTFFNPDPSPNAESGVSENFGAAVLWVNNTTAMLGAPGKNINGLSEAGAAYLYTDPQNDPAPSVVLTASQYITTAAHFGWALTTVSASTQLLVGAPYDSLSSLHVGGAYRFDLAGTLVMTMTKPVPAEGGDQFGYSVAGFGNDAVVSANLANYSTNNSAGEVYRFNGATGVLSQTISTPAASQIGFGQTLAMVGATLLVGAPNFNGYHGAVYAYDLSGPMPALTWVYSNTTDPGPFLFGSSIAVSGNNLLIGEPLYQSHGRAYLYDATNHAVLNTYEIPDLMNGGDENFGAAVSIFGGQVLIGAPGYDTNRVTPGNNAGRAYLFNAEAPYALVQPFDNPSPAQDDAYGTAVAVGPGTDLFLVGAPLADSLPGAVNAGKVYLFGPNVNTGATLYLPLIQR